MKSARLHCTSTYTSDRTTPYILVLIVLLTHNNDSSLSLLYYLLVYYGIMCDFLVVNDDFFNFPCANWVTRHRSPWGGREEEEWDYL